MPAADYSKITEIVKAGKRAWTSSWAELKIMNRNYRHLRRLFVPYKKNTEYHLGIEYRF